MTRRRARTALLVGLVAAGLAQLGLAVALDTARPHWRDPEAGHRLRRLARVRRTDARESPRPLLVVLGSSRAEMGVSPDRFGLGDAVRGYNLSQAGATAVRQELNWHRLRAAGLRPDFLLVEVIPALLASDAPADATTPAGELALADVLRVRPECDDFPAFGRAWAFDRLAGWHAHRHLLQDHWAGGTLIPAARRRNFQWADLQPDGWAPFDSPQMPATERRQRTLRAEAEYRPLLDDYWEAPRPARVYRRLLRDAQAAGAKTAVLLMPESPTFRNWYRPGTWAESRRRVQRLASDTGAAVCDAGDWCSADGDFADGHHLLRHAAEPFSRRLGGWVRGWMTERD